MSLYLDFEDLDQAVPLYLVLKDTTILNCGGYYSGIDIPSGAALHDVLSVSQKYGTTSSTYLGSMILSLEDNSIAFECITEKNLPDKSKLLIFKSVDNDDLFTYLFSIINSDKNSSKLLDAIYYYENNGYDIHNLKDVRYCEGDALTLSDVNGCVLWANSDFEIMTGRTFDQAIGQRPRHSMYGSHSVYVDPGYVDSNVAKAEPFYFENIAYHISDKQYWFGATVYPLLNRHNKVIGRVHIMNDITERKLKELDLEKSDSILKLALDTEGIGAWTVNTLNNNFVISGNFKGLNALKYCDQNIEELLNNLDSIYKLGILRRFKSISRGKPDFDFDFNVRVQNEIYYLSVKGKSILWDSIERPVVLVGTIIDKTEEVEYLKKIEQQKTFYNSVLDRLPSDIVVWDSSHIYRYINATAIIDEEMRNWLIGKDDFQYCEKRGLDLSIAENRRKQFNSLLEKKLPIRFLEKYTKNGLQYKLRIMHPYFSNGEIEYVVGYGIDITEQIRNEELANYEKRNLERLLEVTTDGILKIDLEGRILANNMSFAKLFYSDENLVGRNINTIIEGPEYIDFYKQLEQLPTTNKMKGTLAYKCRVRARTYYFNYSSIYIDNANIVQPQILIRFEDITRIIDEEERLNKIVKNEVLLNHHKSQFIRIASHELRTPLTIIRSNADIISDLVDNKYITDSVNAIIEQSDYMLTLLNQLLIANKIESNTIAANKSIVTITDLLNPTILNRYMPYHDGRNLNFVCDTMDANINVDLNLFNVAITNLIENAFKYSYAKESPVLKIYLEQDELLGRIVIEIKDKGIGIPKQDIINIGKTFFRGSNVKAITGTGIGLMIVKYFTGLHDADLLIDSNLGIGTSVKLKIPIVH